MKKLKKKKNKNEFTLKENYKKTPSTKIYSIRNFKCYFLTFFLKFLTFLIEFKFEKKKSNQKFLKVSPP